MLQDVDLQYVNGVPTFGGPVAATAVSATGLTGATGATRYVGATVAGPPVSGTFATGDFINDQAGTFWTCTTAGSPGTWACASQDLNELLIAPAGATGETCPRYVATGSTSSTAASGTVYVRAIGLRAGITVNDITLFTAAGNITSSGNLTHAWVALLDKNLVVRAVSADQAAGSFASALNTPYPLAVLGAGSAVYVTAYTGAYYIAQSVSISAGNMPQFAASGSPSTGVLSASPALSGTAGSQAAPPSIGATLASGTVTVSNTSDFYAYTS